MPAASSLVARPVSGGAIPAWWRALRATPRWVVGVVVAFWLGNVVTDAATMQLDVDGYHAPWGHFFVKRGILAIFWVATSLFAIAWYADRPVTGANARSSLAAATGLAAITSVAYWIYCGAVLSLVSGGKRTWSQGFATAWSSDLLYPCLTFFQIAVAVNAQQYYLRMVRERRGREELDLRLRETELMLLRAQLEPHFLFNTLNSIAALVRLNRQQDAVDALHRLSTLLRGVLDVGARQVMPWHWESAFAKTYIALQKLRFGDNLQVDFDDEGVPDDWPAPILVLQPLLENAIRHGPLLDDARCHVTVRVRVESERVRIEVRNPMGSPSSGGRTGTGMGLENLVARLERTYGAAGSVTRAVAGGEFVVVVTLPLAATSAQEPVA
jgi:Histidine kinase